MSWHTDAYPVSLFFFFFNDTATTEIYTLSLHDALPISRDPAGGGELTCASPSCSSPCSPPPRSEEHTSELQSPCNLVCRLLLEKKKKDYANPIHVTAERIAQSTLQIIAR